MTLSRDDLFSTSLTAADDILIGGRPHAPQHLILTIFFAGWAGGLAAFGWNYRELGLRSAAYSCWVAAVSLSLLQAWINVQVVVLGEEGVDAGFFQRSTVRITTRVALVITGLLIARHQKPRYHMYSFHGRPAAPNAMWLILVVVVSLVIQARIDAILLGLLR